MTFTTRLSSFAVEGAPEGWRTTLDKLEQEVARIAGAHAARSVVHASFSLERTYDAVPAQVFHALSDKAAKAALVRGRRGLTVLERAMDVRPGGRERLKGRWANGMTTTFDAVYYDVVPNERLVYAYEMHLDERKISVSLATIELKPGGPGPASPSPNRARSSTATSDGGSRERGTGFLLDRLGASLQG